MRASACAGAPDTTSLRLRGRPARPRPSRSSRRRCTSPARARPAPHAQPAARPPAVPGRTRAIVTESGRVAPLSHDKKHCAAFVRTEAMCSGAGQHEELAVGYRQESTAVLCWWPPRRLVVLIALPLAGAAGVCHLRMNRAHDCPAGRGGIRLALGEYLRHTLVLLGVRATSATATASAPCWTAHRVRAAASASIQLRTALRDAHGSPHACT